jgi:hypothetical protein
MGRGLARPFGRLAAALMFAAGLAAVVLTVPLAARAQSRAEKEAERTKWENKIVFFGEEDTGLWSLRIQDKANPERARVKYTELWKYDPDGKRWVKVDDGAPAVQIVPVKEKPDNAPPDSQNVADLPIKQGEVGIYWAKWRVNDAVEGATYCRIGPALVGRAREEAMKKAPKPPEGYLLVEVPLNINKAELQAVPDPRTHTGQGGATDKPASRPAQPAPPAPPAAKPQPKK